MRSPFPQLPIVSFRQTKASRGVSDSRSSRGHRSRWAGDPPRHQAAWPARFPPRAARPGGRPPTGSSKRWQKAIRTAGRPARSRPTCRSSASCCPWSAGGSSPTRPATCSTSPTTPSTPRASSRCCGPRPPSPTRDASPAARRRAGTVAWSRARGVLMAMGGHRAGAPRAASPRRALAARGDATRSG